MIVEWAAWCHQCECSRVFSEEFIFKFCKTVEGLSGSERVAKEADLLATGIVVDILHVCNVVVFAQIVKAEIPIGWCPVVSQVVVLAVRVCPGVREPDIKATLNKL